MRKLKRLAILIGTVLFLVSCGTSQASGPNATTASTSSQLRGTLTASSGQTFEYSLSLPENWRGKYAVEAHPNYFKVDYLSSTPDNEATNNPYLFGISVFTRAEWEAEQKGPHGAELMSRDGFVFVESIGLDNPLSGSAAEELQRMAGQVSDIVRTLSVTSVAPVSVQRDSLPAGESKEILTSLHSYW